MIKASINSYLLRSSKFGTCMNKRDLDTLNFKLNGLIPDWFTEAVTQLPVSGIEVGWLAFPDVEEFDGIEWVTVLDARLLSECNLDSYLGNLLRPLGYFSFGYGSSWSGNCFAFNPEEGEDPPVYEVWHDAAGNSNEMRKAIENKEGVKMVSKSFSSFFNDAFCE
jgi:hypothetical protein